MVNGLYYRRYYCLDTDNIPPDGTPVLIAMNHHCGLNDALGVLFAMNDRKVHFIARADAFDIHPLLKKFMLWVGILPAFRMMYQGEESLSKNDETFALTEQRLLDGHTVLIFPEVRHLLVSYMRPFSYGYTKMAFQAAEKDGFQKEIFILPGCNHYSAYGGFRNQILVRFGTPVSLQPYYELYKTKPRTAQREVNKLVRAQVSALMLDIKDADRYDDIEFARRSAFCDDYARSKGLDPEQLPQKLEAEKRLCACLEGQDLASVKAYREALAASGLEDRQLASPPDWFTQILKCLILLITLPVAVLAAWPALPAWFIPWHFTKKVGDPALEGSFTLGIDVLVLMPLAAILTFCCTGALLGWQYGLIHVVAIPFLCIFEWYYARMARETFADFRFLRTNTQDLQALYRQAISTLKTLTK